MAIAPQRTGIGIRRHFTVEGVHPYEEVVWEQRDSRITNYRDGSVAFEQLGVEVPSTWSVNATNILAQKYFRGTLGLPERETSLKQVADRVVDTITAWGIKDGYFVDNEEAEVFSDELKHLIIHQKAAFNSPVWFNIGVKDVPQQASACFILAVEDKMSSILNWYTEEGVIFKGGSGAGVNLSKIRASEELLNGGGTASGPVSFMRGADASAGTIKSGGKTRRAAKMVMLDVDHPDIEHFIWCKAHEEKKARALADAGFDMSLDGSDITSIQYQNANNSVRVSDEFMQAVLDDADWDLIARADGAVVRTVKARALFRQFAEAAWECADPGMQFDTTINDWHTSSNTDRINGSNPCSEYMHIDNSACNLASLNLMKFIDDEETFDVEGYKAAIEVVFTAQEILVGNADYPTKPIGENSVKFRQLGLGYANLGALLMANGLPYDSDAGRAWAGALTALMTGHAYATSAKTSSRMGPHAGYHENQEPMLRVLRKHQAAASEINEELVPTELLCAAQEAWDEAVELAETHGVRNAQATVLAPTGTIGLLMDCDTTGVEPDLGLVKTKKLVGGGTMSIVNQTVTRALGKLGYNDGEAAEIVAYINENMSILGAPHIKPEHLPVFACSMGDNTIHYLGHVKMMGAVQPFISGAISKTVNMPEDVSVEDIEQIHIDAWQLGVKAVAIYRDNCKVAQPLSTTKKDDDDEPVVGGLQARITELENALAHAKATAGDAVVVGAVRERLPRRRASSTFSFRVADCEGYVTVGEYEDGRPGEVFIKVSKQGSTLAGIMDAFSISISLGLQHGVPLATYVRKYSNMRFEPAGITDDADLRIATSLVDYMFRRLALDYLTLAEREELGVLSSSERTQPTLPGVEELSTETVGIQAPAQPIEMSSAPSTLARPEQRDAPYCYSCGDMMQRAGSCYVCSSCGTTSGCS
ncbi:MAG: vitamin B12-dependent ribonucleotide reductase [Actinobacteria bacterium]|jgi:ribonucleoside-diphosphate reductase alpha chain|uniref:Vitamin B12-dependent ribonucleotide reductase n=1 Tax=freshwater metagenome TaxID=449393 RepID=A0A6J6ZJ06_9ZZZZ|nr:vitamin B12-dependent ribonucleotide reductase [Actinomycetota bacterium]MSX09293.1 vitamin B12-dependent ribonucleotide reductase [Actinomycetota bacterium]MSX67728.1 vitamin B12-dependent ribonucleotide reductase [Actinomycetota bacterium]